MSQPSAPIKTGSSGIEWTTRTWNPTTGCDKVSAGCRHCYAEPLAYRLHRMGNPRYTNGFELTLHADKIKEPTKWRKPDWVFVNSMSDMLHAGIPDSFVFDVFKTMGVHAPWHRYQVLTKRADRWPEISRLVIDRLGHWPANVLPGVTVENRKAMSRVALLGQAGDADTVRMLSVEPLLESLCDGDVESLALEFMEARIGWVITGGEAGFKARGAELDWFCEVRDACTLAEIPFFHKQHGGRGTSKTVKRGGTLALLDGQLHHEMPEVWAAPAPGRAKSAQVSLLVNV
jgi:protein gp37